MKKLWKKTIAGLFMMVLVGVIGGSPSSTQGQTPATSSAGTQVEHEHHPLIHHAIRSLKHAKEYLEHASHDFGGHRQQALEDCEQAIQQLRLCLDGNHAMTTESNQPPPSSTQGQKLATPSAGTQVEHERHPLIHHAIRSLKHAKEYLEHASHDFDGHRQQALKDCEQAIQQLRLCLESDTSAGKTPNPQNRL